MEPKTEDTRGSRPGGGLVPDVISGKSPGYPRLWVEVPQNGQAPAAWCYPQTMRVHPGDKLGICLSSTTSKLSVSIYRDGLTREDLMRLDLNDAPFQDVPHDGYMNGFGWAPSVEVQIPTSTEPGAYIIEMTAEGTVVGHGFFLVSPQEARRDAIALVLSTATWTAYNDIGGASHYFGLHPGTVRGRSPQLSLNRPWARGQIWLPENAPRMIDGDRSSVPMGPRYKSIEWAYLHNATKYYAAAGWASYERHFVRWCEANGYTVDLYTQSDLHEDPELLTPYRCAAFVGHDEYWSWDMRRHVDEYVKHGGTVARFAGNFMWQIRLDTDEGVQTSYKYDARSLDPVSGTPQEHTLTGTWDDPLIGYPGAATFGVGALRGMYAAFGAAAQRVARGFVVFREDHWFFRGTGLGYADMMGDDAAVFGYEVDGLDYVFSNGLPEPTHRDGAPEGTQILAMNWATSRETGLTEHSHEFMLGDHDAVFAASVLDDSDNAEAIDRRSRTAGMIVHFKSGAGEVLTVGGTEWVNGLRLSDYYVERCTRNVLDRFLRERTP